MTTRINPVTALNEAKCSAWENIKGWINNISYQIEEFSVLPFLAKQSNCFQVSANHSPYYLSGKKIDDQDELLFRIQGLIWITYRKNVKIAPNYCSDVGWGCLLRVTQMAFGNMLASCSNKPAGIDRPQIIKAFIEDDDAAYSLTNFVEAGAELWNRSAGDWYSMTEAAMMLEVIQQRKPLEGTEHISVVVYNQIISIDELLELSGYSLRSNQPINPLYKGSNTEQISSLSSISTSNKKQKELFLMVTTTFNACSRAQDERKMLELMELSIFSSIIGGIPQKARLIVGKQGDRLCYLDPHFVQQPATKSNLQQSISTFECKRLRWMSCSQLDRNITFCFHIRSISDINILIETINKYKQKQRKDLFIDYNWTLFNEQAYQTEQTQPDFQLLDLDSISSQEVERFSWEDIIIS